MPETTRGYYIEAVKFFNRLSAVTRFDYVETEHAAQIRALSSGLGMALAEGLDVRAEYRYDFNSAPRQLLFQMVAGF